MKKEIEIYSPSDELASLTEREERLLQQGRQELLRLDEERIREEERTRKLAFLSDQEIKYQNSLTALAERHDQNELKVKTKSKLSVSFFCDRNLQKYDGKPVFKYSYHTSLTFSDAEVFKFFIYRSEEEHGICTDLRKLVSCAKCVETVSGLAAHNKEYVDYTAKEGTVYNYHVVLGWIARVDVPYLNPDIEGAFFIRTEGQTTGAILETFRERVPSYQDKWEKADNEAFLAEKERNARNAGATRYQTQSHSSPVTNNEIASYIQRNTEKWRVWYIDERRTVTQIVQHIMDEATVFSEKEQIEIGHRAVKILNDFKIK